MEDYCYELEVPDSSDIVVPYSLVQSVDLNREFW